MLDTRFFASLQRLQIIFPGIVAIGSVILKRGKSFHFLIVTWCANAIEEISECGNLFLIPLRLFFHKPFVVLFLYHM